jgi:hypothetical protein
MLTNFDINRITRKLDLPIVGVFCKDELKELDPRIGSYYINLQNSGEGAGSHWVFCKLIDEDDSSSDSDSDEEHLVKAVYFDSFGVGMPKEVGEFLERFKPIGCNNRHIQNIKSTQCGWYCIACDYVLTHKRVDGDVFNDYEKFLNMWSDKPDRNLAILKSLFKPL